MNGEEPLPAFGLLTRWKSITSIHIGPGIYRCAHEWEVHTWLTVDLRMALPSSSQGCKKRILIEALLHITVIGNHSNTRLGSTIEPFSPTDLHAARSSLTQ